MRRRGCNKGLIFAAFGAGMLLALCFFCVTSGGLCMKIVVIKSPKALRPILKLLFKIKDSEEDS